MSPVLIIGGSRGLGKALVTRYHTLLGPGQVITTIRSPKPKAHDFEKGVDVIGDIDLSEESCVERLVRGLGGRKVGVVVYVAGILIPEVCELHLTLSIIIFERDA
jgi:NAD(P)-dependent dehydrogenase (short-subunit alcohol dehydrogenase family)